MKSVVFEKFPRFGLTLTTFLRSSSSLLYRNHLRSSNSTRRLRNLSSTTGATVIRCVRAAEDKVHKRTAPTSARMVTTAPAIILDRFILGTFVASLFAFVLLYVLRRRSNDANLNQSKKNRGIVVAQNGTVSTTEDDSGIDVIIVGAGVAGAALAHTLGKVDVEINCRFFIYFGFLQIRLLFGFTFISGNAFDFPNIQFTNFEISDCLACQIYKFMLVVINL